MRTIHEASGAAREGGHFVVRLLRSTGLTFLANPLAFAAGATCVYLLVSLLIGISRARMAGVEWGLSDVMSCGGCLLALALLACLAVGHIFVVWLAGWRGRS